MANTSCWHTSEVNPESLERVIEAYRKAQANLLKHESGFPDAKSLSLLVKEGVALYGMEGVCDGMNSEGSDWIIKELEEEDERPLWASVWGGVNTLAQSLDKIQKTKSKKEAKRLISKLRVYAISDQDESGIWTNAHDNYTPYIPKEYGRTLRKDRVSFDNYKVTLWRWRDDFQNDFAARMDWCLMSYAEANHPPVPVLIHPEEIPVKSGEDLSGSG